LRSYIEIYTIENSDVVFFDPVYSDKSEIILQNTYYMVEILQILDMYDLNTQKIENFIIRNINYTSIKNVYYSYKLVKLLDLDIDFDAKMTQELVYSIYSEEMKEFYSTTDRTSLNQEILLWISDMARNDELKIDAQYQEGIMFGRDLSITASLYNIILSSFDYNLSFVFESSQVGDHSFDKVAENEFSVRVFVKQDPQNHPIITGKIVAYDSGMKLTEKSISVTTFYPEKVYQDELNGTITLSVLLLLIPGAVIVVSEKKLRKAISRK
jgi:hypothetical protein